MIWYELDRDQGWQILPQGATFNPASVGLYRYRVNGKMYSKYTPEMQAEVDKIKMWERLHA